MANLRMVRAKAGLNRARREAYEDVFQEAVLGLTRAVQLWDYRKGFQFSTFAEPWIRQTANLELYATGRVVAPRYGSVPTYSKIETARGALAQVLGREPTYAEVAKKLDIQVEALKELIVECAPVYSLDTSVESSGSYSHKDKFIDRVEDEFNFTDDFEQESTARAVLDACHALTPVEREMVTMRFGLDGEDPVSNEEMADRMGMRRETARVAFKRALDKLRSGPLGEMLAAELEQVS